VTDPAVQLARLQQQVEELGVAAIRALTGQADLHLRGQRLYRGTQRLPSFAPHLHCEGEAGWDQSFRGVADGLALRLLHSDEALHAALQPEGVLERALFDLLEQFRCESLADPAHAGVVHNLRLRHEAWSRALHDGGLTESLRGLLLYALTQAARSHVMREPVVAATEGAIESMRQRLAPRIGASLAALRHTRGDQRVYAGHALAIVRAAVQLLHEAGAGVEPGPRESDHREAAARTIWQQLLRTDSGGSDTPPATPSGDSRVLGPSGAGYQIYTRAYDREVRPAALLRAAVLAAHREQLDRRVAAQGANLPRLAREIQALLAEPAVEGWNDAAEQGRIDGRRLARLIASPTERRLFRDERVQPQADAVLALLVDCSGSMRVHAESVAMLAEILLRAAEQAGVANELLGFTTGAWHGGRALREWRRAGSPPSPGRLNELQHLVFKSAGQRWRHARRGIAALLEPTLFREGVDGEAVQWACTRLRAWPARRRLLLVVSDGCPTDSATEQANDAHYLDRHLREVVIAHTREGAVEIAGLGVGLDLSPYYARSRAIDLQSPPGNRLVADVLELIGGRRSR